MVDTLGVHISSPHKGSFAVPPRALYLILIWQRSGFAAKWEKSIVSETVDAFTQPLALYTVLFSLPRAPNTTKQKVFLLLFCFSGTFRHKNKKSFFQKITEHLHTYTNKRRDVFTSLLRLYTSHKHFGWTSARQPPPLISHLFHSLNAKRFVIIPSNNGKYFSSILWILSSIKASSLLSSPNRI